MEVKVQIRTTGGEKAHFQIKDKVYDCLGIRIHPSTASSAVYTLLDKAAEGDAGQGQVDETASSLIKRWQQATLPVQWDLSRSWTPMTEIDGELRALVEEAQAIEDTANNTRVLGDITVAGSLVGLLVAAVELEVVAAGIVGLADGDLVHGGHLLTSGAAAAVAARAMTAVMKRILTVVLGWWSLEVDEDLRNWRRAGSSVANEWMRWDGGVREELCPRSE
ncbi:hypothetical protein ACCO45_000091 [Purpureocillium lilacinum]|uniref:Uncharacterized protein n=1 Tax=Purpureocillium lilacinum TaxID=33203 RepID=A0ACC4E474_PURLI